jgi:hypothetical protein
MKKCLPLCPIVVLAAVATSGCSGGGSAMSTGTTTASTTTTSSTTTATASTGPLALGPFAQHTIGAPLAATLGSNAPLIATGATPNFATGPATGTVFPLVHSVLISDPPGDVTDVADPLGDIYAATFQAGVTLTFLGNNQYELKFSNIDVVLTADGIGVTIPNSNNTRIGLTTSNLTYTTLATWIIPAIDGAHVAHLGMGVSGYQTPASGVPTSGTATYLSTGGASGNVVVPSGVGAVKGDVSINVNFASGALSGSLTNMNVSSGGSALPWNNVSLSGTLSGATISGTATATSPSASNAFTFAAGSTGFLNGALYGPTGQELGAVWSVHDNAGGGKSALGVLGATKQ